MQSQGLFSCFVLNSLIRYASVIAYMKFLSPPLRVVMLDELKRRFGITSRFFFDSSTRCYCLATISGVNNEIFILASKHSFV